MPPSGKNKRERPQKTYIDQLIEETGLQMEKLKPSWPREKIGSHSSEVIFRRDSTSEC